MRLTFGGDFAWPQDGCLDVSELTCALASEPLVVNLEGALLQSPAELCGVANKLKFNLYSGLASVDLLKQLNVVALGLANNHISDYIGACESTTRALNDFGIPFFGIQSQPFVDVAVNGRTCRLVGVVSPLTEIGRDSPGFCGNRFDPRGLLAEIAVWRAASSDLMIIVYAHWGYELSVYPLPADREWAKHAIAAGADAVIGHHPHVVQGVEMVGAGVIAYSLGNFALPQVRYRDRSLTYKDSRVATQLAVTLGEKPLIRWFTYDREAARVIFDGEEVLEDSVRIRNLTPFAGMDDATYRAWYREAMASGTAPSKRGEPVLWSYQGGGYWHVAAVTAFLAVKRFVRKWLIAMGAHKPYNWRAEP